MAQVLNEIKPDAVAVPGWFFTDALSGLLWCLLKRRPMVLMSDSTFLDAPRTFWKEGIKKRLVGACSSALVAGVRQREYVTQLGMPADSIVLGYDVVDNCHFEQKAEGVRGRRSEDGGRFGLPEKYFLASARFVEKKNLPRLIQAYARYRKLAEESEIGDRISEIWKLVLLGDGPLRGELERLISDLRLQSSVRLPGFKQYSDLPAYYGLASAFIHASTTEQWGLVVNEAMASGLPVLVSNRCGCAPDLVQEGINGFTFDPYNVEQLAELMFKISAFQPVGLSAFGLASQRIISDWRPERFAQGLKAAAEKALAVGPPKANWFDRLLLRALLLR